MLPGRQISLVKPFFTAELVPMLTELREHLFRQRVQLDLRYDQPDYWAARGHEAVVIPWAAPVPVRSVTGRYVEQLDAEALADSDLVVVHHSMATGPLWARLTRRRIGGSAVALWGDPRPRFWRRGATHALMTQTTATADWYFADSQKAAGFARKLLGDAVTVVGSGADFGQGLLRATDRLNPRVHQREAASSPK